MGESDLPKTVPKARRFLPQEQRLMRLRGGLEQSQICLVDGLLEQQPDHCLVSVPRRQLTQEPRSLEEPWWC
jgi:hypothetical protein